MKLTARVRRVGNSLSVVIPAEETKSERIEEGDIVQIEIQKKVNVKAIFGSVKFKKSSQDMKNEDREGWGD